MGPVDKPTTTSRPPSAVHVRRSATLAQCASVGVTMCLLLLTASVVQTGPVIRSRRMIREIYVENSAASPAVQENTSSEVPTSSNNNATASDMCLYDGSYIERSAIACEKKHGCRAIQKTGECCPDYQCECQRDGKTYTNGEKVFDPNTPCRACYCQGGEITCSEVSCYKRNDCDPKYIPGRCCPEYDNCPPLENFKITESGKNTKDAVDTGRHDEETNEVKGNYAAEAEDLAGLQKQQTSTTTTTLPPAVTPSMANDNPLGIKIKEITKAEEIRLTDNRPSAEEQQQQQQQLIASRETTAQPSSTQSEELVNLEHLDVNVPDDDGENGTKIVRHTDGDGMRSDFEEERKESSASDESLKTTSAENRLESNEASTVGSVSSTLSESDEWMDVKEFADSSAWSSSSFAISTTTQAPSLAPSTSGPPPRDEEVVSEGNMKPSKQDNALPAVVQIGDKLVIVDHNQPKPITVIQVEEVEGLQRGEDDSVYDQEMYTERNLPAAVESGRESSKKLKLHHSADLEQETLSTQADSSAAYETVYHSGSTEQAGGGSSEEIFETQLYTEGPDDAAVSVERNDTQQGEPLSVSREEFLHMGDSQEPAKIQQEEEHTTASTAVIGSSTSYSSIEEGSTTMSDLPVSLSSEASGDEMIYDTHFYTEGPNTSSEDHGPTLGTGSEESSTAGYIPRHPAPVADELAPQHETYIEDNEHELIHPGFQPIPEDFSLPQLDQPAMEMEMEHHAASPKEAPAKQEKILSEVLDLKRNMTSTTSTPMSSSESSNVEGVPSSQEETSNSPAWLKEDPQPQLRSPGEPLLIPEWERKNSTGSSGNSSSEEELDQEASGAGSAPSDFQMLKMGSEEYVDAGEGSGSVPSTPTTTSAKTSMAENRSEEEVDEGKVKEPISSGLELGSAANSLLDIDSPASTNATDDQSDSVKHNPKNDVESLKYDEDENNATAEEAIPKKVQQLEPSEREVTGGVHAPTLTSV
ncbi:uncharacterized protein LOC128714654 [Anopheles marshallii]|uniref:uncharacterized protein LOC128714654 n=1 Tax=Anopheles marshallii TaxID=1521116 RepID=UPI00237AF899|nr:uncharacterized protein LOC128714654 [Anopheles marshallii]